MLKQNSYLAGCLTLQHYMGVPFGFLLLLLIVSVHLDVFIGQNGSRKIDLLRILTNNLSCVDIDIVV